MIVLCLFYNILYDRRIRLVWHSLAVSISPQSDLNDSVFHSLSSDTNTFPSLFRVHASTDCFWTDVGETTVNGCFVSGWNTKATETKKKKHKYNILRLKKEIFRILAV